MKEKDIQSEFGKKNAIFGVFELKICKTKRWPVSALKDHQMDALMAVSTGNGLYHKISDQPIFPGMKTRFNRKKPFDCFFLKDVPAYVVIVFYEPRKKKMAYYVPAERMYKYACEYPECKSYTEDQVRVLAKHALDLTA